MKKIACILIAFLFIGSSATSEPQGFVYFPPTLIDPCTVTDKASVLVSEIEELIIERNEINKEIKDLTEKFIASTDEIIENADRIKEHIKQRTDTHIQRPNWFNRVILGKEPTIQINIPKAEKEVEKVEELEVIYNWR